jgi:tetratricopeptide (TPR) repeat protein
MRDVQQLAGQVKAALDANEFADALEKGRDLKARLGRFGLESGWVHWVISVCLDRLDRHVEALHEIRKATALDTLDTNFQHSVEVIIQRLRQELARLDPDDEDVARIYQLLTESCANDVQTHLAMARHYLATGRVDRARALLEALTALAPASRDVWLERAKLERLAGNEEAAAVCEAEALAMTSRDVLFAIPAGGTVAR